MRLIAISALAGLVAAYFLFGRDIGPEVQLGVRVTPEIVGETVTPTIDAPVVNLTVSPDDLLPADVEFVCRAAIAELMGRPINIVRVAKTNNGVVETYYRRSSDNSVWKNACRLVGSRVLWASIENDRLGRWRNDARDEVVTFRVFADHVEITQTFTDGSSIAETFER